MKSLYLWFFGQYMFLAKNLAWLVQIILLMKIAIPHWQGRVSPVFDVARNLLLVDVIDGSEQNRRDVSLDTETLGARINLLAELGTEVLVCGAISKPLEMGLVARGLQIIPQTCGQVEQVLAAYISGQLDPNAFLMPGCCGRRRQFRGQGRGGGRGRNMRKDF